MSHRFVWLRAALLLFAVALVGNALADLATAVLPAQLDDPRWRFGAFGLVTGQVVPLLTALLVVMAIGVWMDARGAIRSLAVLSAAVLLLLMAGAGMFALDTIQLHGEVGGRMRRTFDLAVIKAAVVTLLGAAVLLSLTIGGWRASREHRRKEGEPLPIVMPDGG